MALCHHLSHPRDFQTSTLHPSVFCIIERSLTQWHAKASAAWASMLQAKAPMRPECHLCNKDNLGWLCARHRARTWFQERKKDPTYDLRVLTVQWILKSSPPPEPVRLSNLNYSKHLVFMFIRQEAAFSSPVT